MAKVGEPRSGGDRDGFRAQKWRGGHVMVVVVTVHLAGLGVAAAVPVNLGVIWAYGP